MAAQNIVNRLLEDGEEEEFDPVAYLEKTPDEEFEEGLQHIVADAKNLYLRLRRANALSLVGGPRRGYTHGQIRPKDIVQAVLQLALERSESPPQRAAYNRIKRYGHGVI